MVFGIDEQSMETVVLDLLRRRGLTVAAAETITGGILSARMSAADAAMETFRGARIAPETGAAGGRTPEQACRRGRLASARGVRHARRPCGHRPGCRGGLQARVPFFSPPTSTACMHAEKIMLPPDRRRMREFSVISLLNLLRRNLSS